MNNLRSTFFKLFVLLFITWTLSSCGKEDLTIEEKIVGTWIGETPQESYGLLRQTLTFTTLSVGQRSSTFKTESIDISDCDEDIFICEDFVCTGAYIFEGASATALNFSLELDSGPCIEEGSSTVTFIDDDTIRYTFTPADIIDGGPISGTLKRQVI